MADHSRSLVLRSTPNSRPDIINSVSASEAGWQYLNMSIRRLQRGQVWADTTNDCEYVHVILGGTCQVTLGQAELRNIGERLDVFSGKPYALYLSRGQSFRIEGVSDVTEIATCWVPTTEDFAPRLITPQDCTVELRGGGNASRQIVSIVPPGFPCHRLVAVEVYTPGGNWSSYPPHKHDEHRVAEDGTLLEADLEEIYFYKIDRPEGYAYQRVYTADGRLDELIIARANDIVLIPEGYHPVVSPPGYTTYYLNFLAGSAQSLANTDDPAYSWVKGAWGTLDHRLPLIV